MSRVSLPMPASQAGCTDPGEYRIPRHILGRPDLSDEAKFLYAIILKVGDEPVHSLAVRMGSTPARTRRHLRELAERPLIVLDPEGGDE